MQPNTTFINWRNLQNLTQCHLAERLHVSQGTIGDIERGRIKVSKKVNAKLVKEFGINFSDQSNELIEVSQLARPFKYCPHCGEKLS